MKAILIASVIHFALIVVWSGAQGQELDPIEIIQMGEDNQPLIDDFNARVGTVRQIFIMGPTCGICLRGMADLNDEYIAERQADPRLHTYVVYVPALQAEFEHVAPAAELLRGPRIDHYWQESGMIGISYQPLFETEIYIWDFWFVYGPDAVWEGEMPPEPAFWQHQLRRGFPRERYLDRDVFAAEALALVDALPRPDEGGSDAMAQLGVDEVVIPAVAQGFGVAIRQYREAMGGNQVVASTHRRVTSGLLFRGDDEFALTIDETREGGLDRQVDGDTQLPSDVLDTIHANYDFDTRLIDWSNKGSSFIMDGAVRIDGALHWNLIETAADGSNWAYLIETHSGTLRRVQSLSEDGSPLYSVNYSDFRDVQGAPYAHQVEYRLGSGEVLWSEVYDEIAIARELAPAE